MKKHTIVSKHPLFDPVSERLVLSALIKFGADVFYDVNSVINDKDFYAPENKLIFSAITSLILNENLERPDIGAILGSLNKIDKDAISRFDLTEYVAALSNDTITKENVKPFYESVGRLSLARTLKGSLVEAQDALDTITGKETVSEIIAKAEAPIIKFTNSVVSNDDTVSLADSMVSCLDTLAKAQPKFLGIPTGFPIFDRVIGGGLRKPGVHVVGGRWKSFKSGLMHQIAINLMKVGIPTLILDTELTEELVVIRMAANISQVEIGQIENGGFAKNKEDAVKVKDALKLITEKNCIKYHNISGKQHDEVISIMRKWIMKDVGFDANGNTKDCLIILDYLKTMDLGQLGEFQEYQFLGQMITDYHNFAIKYNIPMLAGVQLNREGINGEDQGVIAGSDRIGALCSSFTILKKKSEEDLASDPVQFGDRKLVVVACRYGPAMDRGEYINVISDLNKMSVKEGNTNIQNKNNRNVAANNNLGQNVSNDPNKITI